MRKGVPMIMEKKAFVSLRVEEVERELIPYVDDGGGKEMASPAN